MSNSWTTAKPAGPMQAKTDSALPPGNTATGVSEIVVPKGTKIYEGATAPNFGQPGGGPQSSSLEWTPMARSMTSTSDITRAAQTIEAFFGRVALASLELPDGWFGGRRGENLHELTLVAARPHRLLLELDGQLWLNFSGAPTVSVDGDEVVLSGFDQLVFDWQSYGQLVPEARVFHDGTVRLVGQ